ncbi:3-deoxy-manno-octulosonate cytidylyltransferase [Propylenella binzhouense]|uniref:3-deoxy-manno-octulosonate cytidylyltransferase n=1 Tax=Propylenella binzhouense TaxID=2555902 RepID=A0A964T7Y3_9HYPH|nr:3-deoxy-manno-octulosonate cytidylyltransferase [Propylenella binzhouense]MYZ49017.1 3-deoxy-manno-octulosonate cytidylyltransferase [Propylenella binzhouense]
MNPVIVIPARLSATRLPRKPLADIGGKPMVRHVVERALEADVGPVIVAVDDQEIVAALDGIEADVVATDPGHPSGSDRIFEALSRRDPDARHDVVINLQGDLPTVAPAVVRAALGPLADPAVAIATLAAEIAVEHERTDPNVVKVVGSPVGPGRLRALYFTRATAPWGDGPLFHHIGLYAYRRSALTRFVGLPQSPLEKRERLEQLRALEAGMRIDVAVVETVPLGVDTPADLERARALIGS